MKHISIRILASLFLIFAFGCEETDTVSVDDLLVLEGYLYQGEPVDSIHLSKTVSFESGDTIYPAVNDAQVFITWNNNKYELQNIDSGYYKYPGNDLNITVSETYHISVIYKGGEITSKTVVPSKPENIALSGTMLSVDTTFTFGPPGSVNEAGITVTWDNPGDDYYFVVIENTDPNARDIVYETGGFPGGGSGGFGPPRAIFRFRSEPFKGEKYTIIPRTMTKYGAHKVRVYRVNQEYVDLYENRQQDSRNLTEPITNVNGGLGIFTAFSYAEADFTVVNESDN